MSDPLALLPYALAAGGGSIDGIETTRLVAAGLTLLQRSPALVRALAGRRAGLLIPSSAPFITALAAAEGRGAVLINPLAAPLEIAYQLDDANVGACFTVSALAARLPDGFPQVLLDEVPRSATLVVNGEQRGIDLGGHHGLSLSGDPEVSGRDEEAVIVYTSAMAGTPLGAVLTHRNLLANARATIDAAEMTRDDHTLAVLPFAHLFGLTVTASAPLIAGGRITTMARFNPMRALELLENEGVSCFSAVPAVFMAVLAAAARKGGTIRAPALRLCICGGAPLARELQDRWFEASGVEMRQGYGLTEAGPVSLFNRMNRPNRRGTLGVPFPGVDVEVRALDAPRAVATGEQGEICVHGESISPGYLRRGSTKPDPGVGLARDPGDWLRTGDLGVQNADGTVSFRGLRKPMFTRNGFNIYPTEIEAAVRELPGVDRVDVTAIPEPARENDIALRVTGSVDEPTIREWCERRLSAYKQPTLIEIVRVS